MQLKINEATIILVAEILKAERGCVEPPVKDAAQAIMDAVRTMKVEAAR